MFITFIQTQFKLFNHPLGREKRSFEDAPLRYYDFVDHPPSPGFAREAPDNHEGNVGHQEARGGLNLLNDLNFLNLFSDIHDCTRSLVRGGDGKDKACRSASEKTRSFARMGNQVVQDRLVRAFEA